jgi:hypothetical protein
MSTGGGATRDVPLALRLSLTMGGALSFVGWGVFGFGMIFWWVFGATADISSWWVFSGDVARAQGHVTRIEQTNFSEGGGKNKPGVPIYRVAYTFLSADERSHSGYSYVVGGASQGAEGVVEVEYLPDDPATSRIKGWRRKPNGMGAIFVVLFPAVGLALALLGIVKGLRRARLLRVGRPAFGRLVDKQPTNVKINNRPVMKLVFEFKDEKGATHRAEARSHVPEKLEDDADEPLVYDPANPSQAQLLDELPGTVRIGAGGRIDGEHSLRGLLGLGLAVLVLGAHGLVGLWFYLG